MFFGQDGLEIGGCNVLRTALRLAPLHEEAVGNASVHPENQKACVTLDPTPVVIVGDIEPLMEAALNPPALAVAQQPGLGLEALGRSAGDQSDFLVFATLSLTQQSGGLCGQGEADVLSADGRGANHTVFIAAFVLFLSASL